MLTFDWQKSGMIRQTKEIEAPVPSRALQGIRISIMDVPKIPFAHNFKYHTTQGVNCEV